MPSQSRIVLINDIDAAGVMFYARAMAMAHEAYELALLELGIDFAALIRAGVGALPVVHAEAVFHQPLRHGDKLTIAVLLKSLSNKSYTVRIVLMVRDLPAVSVTQAHVYVDLASRRAAPLPDAISAAVARLDQDVPPASASGPRPAPAP